MAGSRATRPHEWAIAVAGGLGIAAVLVTLLRGSPPETAAAPPLADVALPSPSPSPSSPSPPPLAIAPAPARAAPTVTPTDFHLRGIIQRPGGGAAAIIELADGRQRLLGAGREIAAGIVIDSIGGHDVTLRSAAGLTRIGFDTERAATIPTAAGPSNGAGTSANAFRLALRARKAGNRITGFTVTSILDIPVFIRAGLKVGDTITAINGNAFESEEKLLELPVELNSNDMLTISFDRGSSRRSVTLRNKP